jgi:branched-chain amino acid transport system substrate-binding protein
MTASGPTNLGRRTLLAATAASTIAAGTFASVRPARAQARDVIRIGVLNDMSGVYRDDGGPTGLACAVQAVEEFASANGIKVEVLNADHQNKADIGASITRQWIDRDGVDAIVDVPTSSVALAVATVCREKNRIMLNSGGGTSELTGAQCSPNTVHWTYDTYMLSNTPGEAMVKAGGDTWFLAVADYAFGQQLQRDITKIVTTAGGKIVGSMAYPFPETTDFSSILISAQASGAKVLCLCNAGGDTVNSIKQAQEFGVGRSMKIVPLLLQSTTVHALGLPVAQGLEFATSYYWDLNDRTRAFQARIAPKTPKIWPNMTQAGNYGSVTHYLKAVASLGAAAAKADGRATVAKMKAMPTDDDCFGPGMIRADGRALHPVYLMQVKTPAESRSAWDLLKLISTTPLGGGYRPMNEGGCPLV